MAEAVYRLLEMMGTGCPLNLSRPVVRAVPVDGMGRLKSARGGERGQQVWKPFSRCEAGMILLF